MTREELKKKYEELILYYDLGPWWERNEQEKEEYEECKLILELLEEPKPCDNCISRDTAIRLAEQGQVQGFEWQLRKLTTLPPVVPTRKKGKWIFAYGTKGKDNVEKCSCCDSHWREAIIYRRDTHEYLRTRLLYCPNCGAEMESE